MGGKSEGGRRARIDSVEDYQNDDGVGFERRGEEGQAGTGAGDGERYIQPCRA